LAGGEAAGDVEEVDAAGAAVIPGFVDAHTHLVWPTDREHDVHLADATTISCQLPGLVTV
jgi:imidazolonepropionase-like amidohydrolase